MMPKSRVFWAMAGVLVAEGVYKETLDVWYWGTVAIYAIWFIASVAITLDRRMSRGQ